MASVSGTRACGGAVQSGFDALHGEGVLQDYNGAVKWYPKSAEQDNRLAQANLGLMYELARGVTQDFKAALKWYRLMHSKN